MELLFPFYFIIVENLQQPFRIFRKEIADLNMLWHKAQTAGKCAFPCNILRMCSIIKGYSLELALGACAMTENKCSVPTFQWVVSQIGSGQVTDPFLL